jgi:DNA-directed RNA polymerase I, II, and III subunit RPABC1
MEIDIVINNLKEMLLDRGDNIDEFNEHEIDIEREEFYNDKDIIEFNTSDTTIIFALSKRLKKIILEELRQYEDNIQDYINKYNNKLNIIIIFNNDTLSTTLMAELNKFDKIMQKNKGMLQYFQINQLLFNPTKHHLVPKHRKLTLTETNNIMEKYLIKSKAQMPMIMHNDVIAKWLGLKQGEIVEIIRYNENSGKSFYYRCCI